jgi:AbrB family looped-hinge helix DNA binding protein
MIFLPIGDRSGVDMSTITTLSSKFQISVPKEIRESQNWKPGQKFAFVPDGLGYVLVPVPTLEELRGIFKGASNADIRDRTDRY